VSKEERDVDGENTTEKDFRYPLNVINCGICGLPPEYCEFGTETEFDKCKVWIGKHCPEVYPDLFELKEEGKGKANGRSKVDEDSENQVVTAKVKAQKPGRKAKPEEVILSLAKKKGRNVVTVVTGLDLFDLKLDDIAKMCKKKYACGASVLKSADQRDTIEIQGDRREDFAEVLRDKYKVAPDKLFITNDKKVKRNAFESAMNDDDDDDEDEDGEDGDDEENGGDADGTGDGGAGKDEDDEEIEGRAETNDNRAVERNSKSRGARGGGSSKRRTRGHAGDKD